MSISKFILINHKSSLWKLFEIWVHNLHMFVCMHVQLDDVEEEKAEEAKSTCVYKAHNTHILKFKYTLSIHLVSD